MKQTMFLIKKIFHGRNKIVKTLTLCTHRHKQGRLGPKVRECQLGCTSTIESPQNLKVRNRNHKSASKKETNNQNAHQRGLYWTKLANNNVRNNQKLPSRGFIVDQVFSFGINHIMFTDYVNKNHINGFAHAICNGTKQP